MFRKARSVLPRQKRLWRLLWLGVLLLHAPATVSVVSRVLSPHTDGNAWSSFVLLSASHLFFLLEILFAPSLRLLTDRRCAVVFLLVVALLHVGVIQHGFPGLITGSQTQFWLLLTSVGIASYLLRRAIRRVRDADFGFAQACRQRAAWRYARASASDSVPINPLSHYRRAPLRAPPIPNS